MITELALFSPLIGFILTILLDGRAKDSMVKWISCVFMGIAALISMNLFTEIALNDRVKLIQLWSWLDVGTLKISFGMLLDQTSVTMMLMVNFVSFLIHVYSIGYMSHDHSINRFMSYLSLFTFFMLSLICSPNLVQLFFGWEGVGLASYLLIGFWHHRPSANTAAIKAFVTNRVGDAGLVLGLAGIFAITSTLDIPGILSQVGGKGFKAPEINLLGQMIPLIPFICVALFFGVMGKSAQLGLHTWLPDAMEGPTPVSALIHAATMVTAGVYLLIRLHPLFALAPGIQNVIAIVGAATCFFAATVGLVQDDIKRIIAYSTCSQLGYMVMAAGMNAVDASFFHLITHAFFKALLFLSAGSVIHALSDEQNIDRMGGLYRYIPFTYTMIWIGSLALAGIPFFAGYYSKDSILASTFAQGTSVAHILFWVGIFVAFMTALYSWRLLLKAFHGEVRADDRVMAHVHEAPWVMRFPLVILALGSVFLGFIGEHYFMHSEHEVPSWVLQAPIIAAVLGITTAFFFFFLKPHLAFNLSRIFKYIYIFFLNKWFFDKLYQRVFVHGAMILGGLFWRRGDINIIDRWGPNGLALLFIRFSETLRRAQTGYIYHYAFAMMLGLLVVFAILAYMRIRFG